MTIAESDLLTDIYDLEDVMSDLAETDYQCVAEAIVRETVRMEKASGAAATLAMLDAVEEALSYPLAHLH